MLTFKLEITPCPGGYRVSRDEGNGDRAGHCVTDHPTLEGATAEAANHLRRMASYLMDAGLPEAKDTTEHWPGEAPPEPVTWDGSCEHIISETSYKDMDEVA